ncbi:hypothetical protein EVAR_80591_1 [Eumeta japonica]|uniref:Uncharacterized protein n=1 Tax=Eumeta variegata TaxID=151549 RepID=A0A4C1TNT1_EUMVA|nr:hypothetical protein EVAR_80591_1 [Eumeta japonica]
MFTSHAHLSTSSTPLSQPRRIKKKTNPISVTPGGYITRCVTHSGKRTLRHCEYFVSESESSRISDRVTHPAHGGHRNGNNYRAPALSASPPACPCSRHVDIIGVIVHTPPRLLFREARLRSLSHSTMIGLPRAALEN